MTPSPPFTAAMQHTRGQHHPQSQLQCNKLTSAHRTRAAPYFGAALFFRQEDTVGATHPAAKPIAPKGVAATARNGCATLVHARREEHVPEFWRGRNKLDRHQLTIGIGLRRPHHVDFDLFVRPRIFQNELCALRHAFVKNDHAASGANRVGLRFDRLFPALKVHENRHAQQDALRAAALLGGRLTQGRARGRLLPRLVRQPGLSA